MGSRQQASKAAAFAQEASEAFAYHDRTHSGAMNVEDIATLMNSMGQYPTQAECQRLVKAVGVTGSTFTLTHFLQMLGMHQAKSNNFEKEIMEAFRAFDHTGSGMISTEELHAALTRIGQRMDPQAATGFIRAADRHNTGQVNYRDFARLLTR
eukprot:m.68205 g.68205  ORF g.68205 m.68205 type:complete len:153 (-) comp8497_c0_seq1:73-531(-)